MVEAHQLTPPDTVVVPQMFFEVEVIHEFEDESQWVLGGGIHSDKWHNVLALETTARQGLFVELLPIDLQRICCTLNAHVAHHVCW